MAQFLASSTILQQFIDWTKRKIRHHFDESYEKNIFFREKEIWWAALGKNIGYEMDGKHEYFSRPVLVLKKYSGGMCFIVPLTTKVKGIDLPYQYVFEVNGIKNAANLSQGRAISCRRLLYKIDGVNINVFNEIMEKFIALLINKKDTPERASSFPINRDAKS